MPKVHCTRVESGGELPVGENRILHTEETSSPGVTKSVALRVWYLNERGEE